MGWTYQLDVDGVPAFAIKIDMRIGSTRLLDGDVGAVDGTDTARKTSFLHKTHLGCENLFLAWWKVNVSAHTSDDGICHSANDSWYTGFDSSVSVIIRRHPLDTPRRKKMQAYEYLQKEYYIIQMIQQ